MFSGPCCWCQGPSCQLVASLLLVGAPPSRRRLLRLFTPGFHPRAVQRLTKSRPSSQLISLRQPDSQDYRFRDQDCFTTSNEIVLLHLRTCALPGLAAGRQDSTRCGGLVRLDSTTREYYALCRRRCPSIPTAASFPFHPPGGCCLKSCLEISLFCPKLNTFLFSQSTSFCMGQKKIPGHCIGSQTL